MNRVVISGPAVLRIMQASAFGMKPDLPFLHRGNDDELGHLPFKFVVNNVLEHLKGFSALANFV
jgi:hypothetical protein